MSEGTAKLPGNGSQSETQSLPKADQSPGTGSQPNQNQSRTTQKPARKKPRKPRTVALEKRLMTVDQYLAKATKDKAVSDLIRSMHKTEIMSYADWEKKTAALLTKKVW